MSKARCTGRVDIGMGMRERCGLRSRHRGDCSVDVPQPVVLQAVVWDDGDNIMVPVRDGEKWVVLGYDAIAYYDSATHVRRNAADMEAAGIPVVEVEAYRMLADLMDDKAEGEW
jgi:hypothetical protein